MAVVNFFEQVHKIGFISSIDLIVGLLVVIKVIWEFRKYILNILDSYHTNKEKDEGQIKDIENLKQAMSSITEKLDELCIKVERNDFTNKIKDLEEADRKRNAQLDKIVDNLKELRDDLAMEHDWNRKTVRNSLRNDLYGIHKECMSKGFITQGALEAFAMASDQYLEADGDSVFRSKIIPEVLALPIDSIDNGTRMKTENMVRSVKLRLNEPEPNEEQENS